MHKVEELSASSRSHEADLRNIKLAVICQCYAWPAGPFITQDDLLTIGYSELSIESVHSLQQSDVCLFLRSVAGVDYETEVANVAGGL